MTILVINNKIRNDYKNLIRAKNIICPQCGEDIKMEINNYKLNLFECKNNHKSDNIPLKEFEKAQMIDLINIKCEICKENNIAKTYNNEFYKCYECNINICPLCKLKDDKDHNIINYDKINYICNKHNEPFIHYCNKCDINICSLCEEKHLEHEKILLKKMVIDKKELITKLNELKKAIDPFNDFINKIIEELNTVKDNINNYYKLEEYMINNYEPKEINYEIIYNINEIINNNNDIINDINQINNNKKIQNKFYNIINLYNKKDINEKRTKANIDEIDKLIKEKEKNLRDLEIKSKALQEEAKAKLKAVDKNGAKNSLAKKNY